MMVDPMPAPTDPNAPAPLLDPATGQPVGPTATYTFAEWCALDAPLLDADKAAFDQFYAPIAAAETAAAVQQAEHSVATSAFARYYGPGAAQKMDRATLDLRMQTMHDRLTESPPAVPAPPPPPAPPTS